MLNVISVVYGPTSTAFSFLCRSSKMDNSFASLDVGMARSSFATLGQVSIRTVAASKSIWKVLDTLVDFCPAGSRVRRFGRMSDLLYIYVLNEYVLIATLVFFFSFGEFFSLPNKHLKKAKTKHSRAPRAGIEGRLREPILL